MTTRRLTVMLGILAGLLAASLPARAQAPATLGACVNSQSGNMRLASGPSVCRAPEVFVRWNVQGEKGDKGDPGIQGPKGDKGDQGDPGPPGAGVDVPGAVGTYFGIARPCPATGDDAGHAAFCQAICGLCPSTPGTMPPEVPLMPTIHADGTVTVNDAGSIAVFHTTAQGAWAADPDPAQLQFAGKTRYQATFMWFQGNGGSPGRFIGVARPRLVTYFDPTNPDNMLGYIQPHFFPLVGPNGLVDVLTSGFKGSLDVTNHYPVIDPLAQLPQGCTPFQNGGNCFGTFHFTIHRVKASVQN